MGKIWTEEVSQRYQDLKRFNITQLDTKAVGMDFVPDKSVFSKIRDGDTVIILRELDNEVDPNACMVVHDDTGLRIGYLKKEVAQDVSPNLAKGDYYLGRVQITGLDKENRGYNLNLRRLSLKDA